MEANQSNNDYNVELWKMKQLIKKLSNARGNGTSMISLIIKPNEQISKSVRMLADEYGTASNIKSRVNRLSVLGAISSAQQRLKLYNQVPKNGLVLYCGTILTEENKEKKVNIDFEPFKPINTSLYLCDSRFHTESLYDLLEDAAKYGFIIMDGNGTLYGTLSGNTRNVLHRFTVDLPKKHGRGGQSAVRFSRLRVEKRHNYVRKAAETAIQLFITNDKVNVDGLILAGSADFKRELCESDMFDPRLQKKVLKKVDISYGGDQGFNQAIELSIDCLANVKFIQEQKLVASFFDEVQRSSNQYCYGVDETIAALEMGAVQILIVFENLTITRYELKNNSSGEQKVIYLRQEQRRDRSYFVDKTTKVDLEVVDEQLLLDFLTVKYKDYGCELEIISDRSSEGMQFVQGFNGIGGILRYTVEFDKLGLDMIEESDDDFDMDDYL